MLIKPDPDLTRQRGHSSTAQDALHQNSTSQWQQPAAITGLCVIWALLSFGQVLRYLHLFGGLTVLILFPCFSAIILSKLRAKAGSGQSRPVAAVLIGGWILGAVAYIVLHAISQSHVLGPGSDRENALQSACQALFAGKFPYYQLTFLHHPITPMPGALVFAAPFTLVQQTGLQNLFWLAIFFWGCFRVLGPNWVTAWFLYVFVLLNPCIMQDFVTGGDFFTNFVYVIVIFSLMIRLLITEATGWQAWTWPTLLGVALSSRPIYSLLYPCLLAFCLQKGGWKTTLRTVGLVLLAELGITLPVYLRDPAHFTPFNVGSNAYSLIPAALHPALTTFVCGLAVASISFFVSLDLRRLCLILGSALTVVTLPLFIIDRLIKPELFPLINLIYLSPGLLLFAVWLLPLPGMDIESRRNAAAIPNY
jgi:hypothetical protein